MIRGLFIGLLLSPLLLIALGVLGNNLWIFDVLKWVGGGLLLVLVLVGLAEHGNRSGQDRDQR